MASLFGCCISEQFKEMNKSDVTHVQALFFNALLPALLFKQRPGTIYPSTL